MSAYLIEITSMLLRWLHVVAAIAWIGESFYFVMHDNSLREPENPEDRKLGVAGELWAVHGGGFYHNLKYATAPAKLPEHLHWSFWKAYTTWLSGFALFAVIYLTSPSLQLINPSGGWHWAATMADWQAGVLAVVFLLLGWVIYNELCKRISPTCKRDGPLSVAVAIMMIVTAYLSVQIFPGRAAFLLTGAVMGTCMAANVFFCIIPGQRRMVAAVKRGDTPNALDGKRGKQRSVHNTYFTLPVVFLMLSNHFPIIFGSQYAWELMILFIFAGALIRQFFVLMHAGKIRPLYPALGVLLIIVALVLAAPLAELFHSASGSTDSKVATLAQVRPIIDQRCVACHAAHPTQPGFSAPPLGIDFENTRTIVQLQAKIKLAVASKLMPLGNATHITPKERAVIADWETAPQKAKRSQ